MAVIRMRLYMGVSQGPGAADGASWVAADGSVRSANCAVKIPEGKITIGNETRALRPAPSEQSLEFDRHQTSAEKPVDLRLSQRHVERFARVLYQLGGDQLRDRRQNVEVR